MKEKEFEVIIKYRFQGGKGSYTDKVKANFATVAFNKAALEVKKLINEPQFYEIHIEEK